MNQENPDYRERLLAAQSQNPALKTKYQDEVRAMLDDRLRTSARWVLAGIVVFLLLVATATAFGVTHYVAMDDDTGSQIFIVALTCELILAGWGARIVWRGKINRSTSGFMLALLIGFFSIWAAGFMLDSIRGYGEPGIPQVPDDLRSLLRIFCTVVIIIGWLPMVVVTILHFHRKTREKLLEIQLQIAELADQLNKQK